MLKRSVKNMEILVVDDQNLVLMTVKLILEKQSNKYNLILCSNPFEVLNIMNNNNVDILLLDIIMPELSGIDVLKEVRKDEKFEDVQIIMLTALSKSDFIKECFEIGANDFIRKPFDEIEFVTRIRAAEKIRNSTLESKKLLSELKYKNEELKEAQFNLIQSEKMVAIGELAAGIAHEINNPIAFVKSNIDILNTYVNNLKKYILYSNDKLESFKELNGNSFVDVRINSIKEAFAKFKIENILNDVSEIIIDSDQGIKRVTDIVISLRNFTRASSDTEKSVCSIKEVIEQVIIIVRNESKYITNIIFELKEEVMILCNKGQIGQVILNVLINSIQAIKSQKRSELGNIEIKVIKSEQLVSISIKDDGPGILEENKSKIFNPFFSTKDVGQGTGLGLSISHDIIVTKHSGKIEVNSKIDEGTEFIIQLPILDEKTILLDIEK